MTILINFISQYNRNFSVTMQRQVEFYIKKYIQTTLFYRKKNKTKKKQKQVHTDNALHIMERSTPAGLYLLKVNSGNTRTISEICSELTIKTQERY